MKLLSAHFDAYKSLLDANFDFTHPCMGMVGINESGKSNVLQAISALSTNNPLGPDAVPKMAKDRAPHIRFVFELTKTETQLLVEAVNRSAATADACSRDQWDVKVT